MAATDREDQRHLALWDALQEAPHRYDFFQLLRLIECAFPSKPRLGQAAHAADEPIRLAQEVTLAFTPNPISHVEHSFENKLRIVTCFLGLLGSNGPLPLHLTEYARDRLRNANDPTLSRFLDIFHHRILSLFYRAFAASRPTSSFDRPDSDRFTTYLGAVFGFGLPSFLNRDSIPDKTRLYFAGRLASLPRNAEGLQAVIAEFFEIPAQIEEFIGEWVDLPISSRWKLGALGSGTLGKRTAIGKRAWLCQSKFRVVIGPLKASCLPVWLPGGESLGRLQDLVHFYVGDQLAWDLRILLDKNERKPWALGRGARLGWTTWLGECPPSLIVKPPKKQAPRADQAYQAHGFGD